MNNKEIAKNLISGVKKTVQDHSQKIFIPTGAMEPAIIAFGNSNIGTTIINLQTNNKGGKSALGAVICRNVMWPNDPEYFDYPLYRNWPFNTNGDIIKKIRIVGTAKNVADQGPVREEILKWWPRGRYTESKDSQRYYSKYMTDTGWIVDVMTFDQHPKDFEGPIISFHWIDEPAKPELIGAFTSRHSHGGVLLFTQTPINAGPMLDVLSDLKDQGMTVIKITSNIRDNSITSGKINSKGTKRGLMTDEEIETYSKSIPPEQRKARLEGIGSDKEGKIYKEFNINVHVRDFDIDDKRFLLANCYTAMDIHETYYPFISWWAILPPNQIGKCYRVCYDEWPDIGTFDGKYYDQIRHTVEFNMTYKDLSEIIKIKDRKHLGYNIVRRGMDPRAAKKTNIQLEFRDYGVLFDLPPIEKIAVQRNAIKTLMAHDTATLGTSIYTEPEIFFTPNCKNMIRAHSRHYWENKDGHNRSHNRNADGVEAERYKDPPDTSRIFMSIAKPFEEIIPMSLKKKSKVFKNHTSIYEQNMSDVCIFRS